MCKCIYIYKQSLCCYQTRDNEEKENNKELHLYAALFYNVEKNDHLTKTVKIIKYEHKNNDFNIKNVKIINIDIIVKITKIIKIKKESYI